MDRETLKNEIRQDYRTWSGGFEPETKGDIEDYIEHRGHVGASDEDLFDILYEWVLEEQARPVYLPTPRLRSRELANSILWFVDDDRAERPAWWRFYRRELGRG